MNKFDFYFNLFFVSHNKVKIVHLLKIFDKLKIPLKIYRSKIREYDEEPSESIEKAMFLSVESVKKKLRHLGMFFIEDSTFTIDAFSKDGKDIPGLATKAFFKKYTHADINKFITQRGKHNRKAVMSSRFTLNIPGSNTPEIFSSHVKGIISEKDNDMAKSNAPIWIKDAPFASFFIPDGESKPLGFLSEEKLQKIDIRFNASQKMEFRLNQFAEIYKNRLQTIRIKSSPKPISSELLFNPPIIIVSGYTSSGKTTIAQYLQKTYGFNHIEESDYVKKEIQKYTSLDRFQAIEAINKKYGMTYFIKKTTDSISKNSKNSVVLSGVRRIEEIDYLKSNFPGSLLLFVDGPHELFEKRHLLKCRAEQDINSDYMKLINAEAKWGMESIKEKSNFVISNNCNFTLLYDRLNRFYNSFMR